MRGCVHINEAPDLPQDVSGGACRNGEGSRCFQRNPRHQPHSEDVQSTAQLNVLGIIPRNEGIPAGRTLTGKRFQPLCSVDPRLVSLGLHARSQTCMLW